MTALDASISMTMARPVLGWGYGNFDEAKKPFVRRVAGVQIYEATSHNTYLTISAELGLIGLLLYLFPMGYWLVQSLRNRRKLSREDFFEWRLVAVLWLAMLHMVVVVSFMDMIRYYHFGTTIWWLLLGLIASVVSRYTDPQAMPALDEKAIEG
jgi:O-antigen ligase